jgi:hypothetical protein
MLQSETGFVTRTGKGPTSVKALNAVLAQERRVGWAIEHGEVTPGISTIAAPVFDVLGRPIAAIGLSVPDSVKGAGTGAAKGAGKDPDKGSGKDSGKVLGKYSDPLAPLVEKVIATAAEVTAKLR